MSEFKIGEETIIARTFGDAHWAAAVRRAAKNGGGPPLGVKYTEEGPAWFGYAGEAPPEWFKKEREAYEQNPGQYANFYRNGPNQPGSDWLHGGNGSYNDAARNDAASESARMGIRVSAVDLGTLQMSGLPPEAEGSREQREHTRRANSGPSP